MLVNISGPGFEQLGLTANVSRGGLLLVTTHMIPDQKDLSIMLAFRDELFELQGEIRWMLMRPQGNYEDTPHRMGVRLLSAPNAFYQFIQDLEAGDHRSAD